MVARARGREGEADWEPATSLPARENLPPLSSGRAPGDRPSDPCWAEHRLGARPRQDVAVERQSSAIGARREGSLRSCSTYRVSGLVQRWRSAARVVLVASAATERAPPVQPRRRDPAPVHLRLRQYALGHRRGARVDPVAAAIRAGPLPADRMRLRLRAADGVASR